MPCYMPSPQEDEIDYLKNKLCRACKLLSPKQMIDIDVIDWYHAHTVEDLAIHNARAGIIDSQNKIKELKKEMDRYAEALSKKTWLSLLSDSLVKEGEDATA